ncbi:MULTISPECIES: hypothetical protein [unclassified Mucilaginibacter]|uniref:hypothetical protein n=1 Tax=unclassified Mucilaginibacter TaxID=2617802 RepID=UPI0031F72200
MKNNTQPQATKLMSQFDNELKKLLMADLKASKLKNQFVSNQLQVNTATAA